MNGILAEEQKKMTEMKNNLLKDEQLEEKEKENERKKKNRKSMIMENRDQQRKTRFEGKFFRKFY